MLLLRALRALALYLALFLTVLSVFGTVAGVTADGGSACSPDWSDEKIRNQMTRNATEAIDTEMVDIDREDAVVIDGRSLGTTMETILAEDACDRLFGG